MVMRLGRCLPLSRDGAASVYELPAHHLVTHAFLTGMTGSGKTGLLFVLVEEALREGVPVVLVDVKGDLTNLLLAFDLDDREAFRPWIDRGAPQFKGIPEDEIVATLSAARDQGLARAGLDADDVRRFRERTHVRILTPGTTAGEPVHLFSSLEHRSALWDTDEEVARDSLATAVSLVLRLVGRDGDPARSREHVLLSLLAERRLRDGRSAELSELVREVIDPPIETVGAMELDAFISKRDRNALAAALNALLASPSFASWRTGAALDVNQWLAPREDGRTPAVIVSVAHLDEDERREVLGLVLDELYAYVRSLSGTSALRALIAIDEVYGMLPPHPANPATKRPIVSLMKQARAFGVGVVLATQNPMDVDYRALSNAGLWFVGCLQTDADRERVIEGLCSSDQGPSDRASRKELSDTVKRLGRRWFVVRNAHDRNAGSALLQPRHTIAWMRGPLTRAELKRVAAEREAG
jgi:DNA helicase HerA-like ATPase